MNRLVPLLIALLSLVLPCSGSAYEFITNRSVGLGQAAILSYPSASEFVNLPLGGWSDREWRIETGFNRAFDLHDFDQFYIAGGYRRSRYAGALGFSQFGKSDLFAEQVVKAALSVSFDSLAVGITGSSMMVRFGSGYGNLSAATLGLGAAWRFPYAIAALSIDNLSSPALTDGSVPMRPQYSLYGEFRGHSSFTLSARMLFEQTQKPRFSLGQRIVLAGSSRLLIGISTAPLQYGGGIELGLKQGVISYNAAYHPVLGLTQTIAVSYGRGHKAEARPDGFK